MQKEVERARFILDEHLRYLGDLRKSGATSISGALPYLREVFPGLGEEEAREVHSYWMKTFSDRLD